MVTDIMVGHMETSMVCDDGRMECLHLTQKESFLLNEFLIGHSRHPYTLSPEWHVRPLYTQVLGYYARRIDISAKTLGDYIE